MWFKCDLYVWHCLKNDVFVHWAINRSVNNQNQDRDCVFIIFLNSVHCACVKPNAIKAAGVFRAAWK